MIIDLMNMFSTNYKRCVVTMLEGIALVAVRKEQLVQCSSTETGCERKANVSFNLFPIVLNAYSSNT